MSTKAQRNPPTGWRTGPFISSAHVGLSMVVYQITNLINGKRYIGVTQNWLALRILNHCAPYLCARMPIKKAIQKYGREFFRVTVLRQCHSVEEMYQEEKRLISVLNPEYNITIGGPGVLGVKVPLESIRRGAAKRTGMTRTEEARKRMSLAQMGRRNSSKGTKRDPSVGKKISAALTGKKRGRGKNYYQMTYEEMASGHSIPVIRISDRKYYASAKDAAKDIGAHDSSVARVCKGKRKQILGHVFRYVSDSIT